MKLYLCGPMTGYADLNHPAFYAAEEQLKSKGYEVINPARMDEELGLDPHKGVMEPDFLKDAAKRDLDAVMGCDGIVLLPEWEASKGAKAELAVAQWLDKKIYLYPAMVEMGKDSILDEAKRLTSKDRQKNYGHPKDNFKRIADLWNSYLINRKNPESPISVEDIAWMMVLLKIARDLNKPTKDNLVDAVGYTRTLAMIRNIE
jgi:hypothetical protein